MTSRSGSSVLAYRLNMAIVLWPLAFMITSAGMPARFQFVTAVCLKS